MAKKKLRRKKYVIKLNLYYAPSSKCYKNLPRYDLLVYLPFSFVIFYCLYFSISLSLSLYLSIYLSISLSLAPFSWILFIKSYPQLCLFICYHIKKYLLIIFTWKTIERRRRRRRKSLFSKKIILSKFIFFVSPNREHRKSLYILPNSLFSQFQSISFLHQMSKIISYYHTGAATNFFSFCLVCKEFPSHFSSDLFEKNRFAHLLCIFCLILNSHWRNKSVARNS